MLRFLGNTTFTLAKKQGMLPLQYRNFSSVTKKAVPKIYGYLFKTAFGGAGFLLGGVTTSPVSKGLQEVEDEVREFQQLSRPIDFSSLK